MYTYLRTYKTKFVCNMNNAASDRGKLLESVVRKSDFSIEALARKMGISRGTVYNHFANPLLDWKELIRYGKVLKYDFSQHYPELEAYSTVSVMEDLISREGDNELLAEARIEIDKWKTRAYNNAEEAAKWKDKYYELVNQSGNK